jgi:hypothetical protein
VTAAETATKETGSSCWCCGQFYPDDELVHLGSHPEVVVCGRCARFLARQARANEDARRPSPAARARQAAWSTRRFVVDHGWHQAPVIGPALRWLGRWVP